jgi:hypothetical protein
VKGVANVAGVLALSLDFRPPDGLCLAVLSADVIFGRYERAEITLTRADDACVDVSGRPSQVQSLVVVCLAVANPDCVNGQNAVAPTALVSSGVLFGLSTMLLAIIGGGICCCLLLCAALIFCVARRTGGGGDGGDGGADKSALAPSFDPVYTPQYGSSLPALDRDDASYQDISIRPDTIGARPAAALPYPGNTFMSQGSELQRPDANNTYQSVPSSNFPSHNNNQHDQNFPSGGSSQYKPVRFCCCVRCRRVLFSPIAFCNRLTRLVPIRISIKICIYKTTTTTTTIITTTTTAVHCTTHNRHRRQTSMAASMAVR